MGFLAPVVPIIAKVAAGIGAVASAANAVARVKQSFDPEPTKLEVSSSLRSRDQNAFQVSDAAEQDVARKVADYVSWVARSNPDWAKQREPAVREHYEAQAEKARSKTNAQESKDA